MKQFRSLGPNCPICAKNTSGIFNGARKLTLYADSKGGFQKLFALESRSGENDDDDGNIDTTTSSSTETASKTTKNGSAGGSWAVVDVEQEGQAGVGDLLTEEVNQTEKEKEKEEKEQEILTSATNASSNIDHAQLLKIASSVGWMQVNAHGQTYWFNQSMNMTSRDIPAQVAELLK